jgi:D-alanyl-D-alanine carboxypeptidase (penicillin-binding protein 5/6)
MTVDRLLASWRVKGFPIAPSHRVIGWVLTLLTMLCLTLVLTVTLLVGARKTYFDFPLHPTVEEGDGGIVNQDGERPYADGASGSALIPWADRPYVIPAKDISAEHAALADLTTGEIIASRLADETIYPASMTKIMTLIVVAENLPSEDSLLEEITISQAVYNEMKAAGSSGIGLEPGERLTVESLLYALMLRSDGIAACELARYVAGSVEDFVDLMNQKADKMGLTVSHFENPTGLYHPDHISTTREIASIMAYAMNMRLCRKVLLTQVYHAPCKGANGTKFTYDLFHNLMITRFEEIKKQNPSQPTQPTVVKVAAGKTGFTDESLYCLVTYAESSDGHGYVCVTAKGESYTDCVKDYITIYNTCAKP